MTGPRGVDCAEPVDVLAEYLNGVLPADRAAEVENHLAGCLSCVAQLRQLQATVDVLGTVPDEAPSAETMARLLAAFRTMD